MRIHEVIEACIDHVALDGVLGSDALSLQQHLALVDPTLDAASFAYIYTILCDHPSINIAISTYPLLLADGSVHTGTAPLPADYQAPESRARTAQTDFDKLFLGGARGRAVALAYSGFEAGPSESQDDGSQKQAKGKHPRSDLQITDNDGKVLFTLLERDDSMLGGTPVAKNDLVGLMEKWGSRLRIRCVEEETYYRLLGTHQKLSKLSTDVLHTLALAARSRERGITAIELGPLIGTSQGTMHYYMKVLIQLGLCVKVPRVQHGTVTNELIYHRFVMQNPNYRAYHKLGPIQQSNAANPPTTSEAEEVVSTSVALHDIDYGAPLTELDLSAGGMVKERIVQLLDHPGLSNHLLHTRHILALLGWKDKIMARHRRSAQRCVDGLIEQGIVERVKVGDQQVQCIRLTKFNPIFQGPPQPTPIDHDAEEEPLNFAPEDVSVPFNPLGGLSTTRTFEWQMTDLIREAAQEGTTQSDLRRKLAYPYARGVEFYIERTERMWHPPHIDEFGISSVHEHEGKERRLRIYERSAFRAKCEREGLSFDGDLYPADAPEGGHFADVSFRTFVSSASEFDDIVHANGKTKRTAPPPKKLVPKIHRLGADGTPVRVDPQGEEVVPAVMKYGLAAQIRGRPRKYIHVVEEDGKINRTVVGQIIPHPDLAAIWIYVKSAQKLVPAPLEYAGLGVPPPITPAMLAKGHTLKWFDKYPRSTTGKQGKGKAKSKGRRPVKIKEEDEDEDEIDELESDLDTESVAGPSVVVMDSEPDVSEVAKKRKGGVKDKEPVKKSRKGKEREVKEDIADLESLPPVETRMASRIATPAAEVDLPTAVSTPADTTSQPRRGRPRKVPEREQSAQPEMPRKRGRPRTDTPPDEETAKKRRVSDDGTSAGGETRALPTPAPPEFDVANNDVARAPIPVRTKIPVVEPTLPSPRASSLRARPPKHSSVLTANDVEPSMPVRALPETVAPRPVPSQQGTPLAGCPDQSRPAITSVGIPPPASGGSLVVPPRVAPQTLSINVEIAKNPGPTSPAKPRNNATSPQITPSSTPAPSSPRKQQNPLVAVAPSGGGRAKVDFGLIRRCNEVYETLKDLGGVQTENRMLDAHKAWVDRVAGTDVPFAPRSAYGMDKHVFRRALNKLESDGRVARTKAHVPSLARRWNMQEIILLPELPREAVDKYITEVRDSIGTALEELKNARSANTERVDEQAFTTVKLLRTADHTQISGMDGAVIETPATQRRLALLKEKTVGAVLLGYQQGSHVRSLILLDALHNLVRDHPDQPTVISTSPKIITLGLLLDYLPVGVFYQCIITTSYDEALDEWLLDPQNRMTPLKDVPDRLRLNGHNTFTISGVRAKYKLILNELQALRLISPMQPVTEAESQVTIESGSNGSRHFRIIDAIGPATHFLLHDYAPVYHLASSLSLLGIMPIKTVEQRARLWDKLERASLREEIRQVGPIESHSGVRMPFIAPLSPQLELDIERLKALRSWPRWRSNVRLLPEQEAIMASVITPTGELTLSSDEEIKQFAYENALPLAHAHKELPARAAVVKRRNEHKAQRAAAETRAIEAKRQAAQNVLRERYHARRQTVRQEWEERVKQTTDALNVVLTRDLLEAVTIRAMSMPDRNQVPEATLSEWVHLSVAALSTQTGVPLAAHRGSTVSGIRFSKLNDRNIKANPIGFAAPAPDGKRRRHHWSTEEDEALIDSEAIIRARMLGKQSKGRRALAQIESFQKVGYNTIRNRFKKLMAEPGRQAYFDQLVVTWRKLWLAKRGTAELPDEYPDSAEDFDLPVHLEYMRAHLIKADLRMAAANGDTTVEDIDDLPDTIEALLEQSIWHYKPPRDLSHSVMFEGGTDETRLNTILSMRLEEPRIEASRVIRREQGMIRATLRSIVSTPNEIYNQKPASRLLRPFPENVRNAQVAALANERVLLRNHTASQTGRFYGYPAHWNATTTGPVATELYTQAAELNRKIQVKAEKDEAYVVPVVSDGGEYAELCQMVSDGTVDIEVDMSKMPVLSKDRHFYNTRKLNDDAFELAVSVRPVIQLPDVNPDADYPNAAMVPPRSVQWPTTGLAMVDDDLVQQIIDVVESAGPDGVEKAELYASTGDGIEAGDLDIAMAALSSEHPCRVFWAGFDVPRLISRSHLASWTISVLPRVLDEVGEVVVDGVPDFPCFPRRWVDVYGGLIEQDFKRCVQGAVANIILRPGINETMLRSKLSFTLDRQETSEVLQYILDLGVVTRFWADKDDDEREERVLPPPEATSAVEEKEVVWFPLLPWKVKA